MISSSHVMTLANSIIGVGILAMPFCFQKCGIVLSIVLLILNNFITRLSCHYLIKSSLLTRRKSFEFLGFQAFGSSGKLFVELCIIGYLIGSCITYFIVVGDVAPQIVGKIFNLNGVDGLRIWVMILVTFFCILPLGMLKNINSLSVVCTASIGFYICLVFKIILESETHILAKDWQNEIVYWESSGVLQCLPIFSMALSCQMQLFEVFESVSNQNLEKLNRIIKEATWMCTLVYIAVGFFGYVAFCTQTFSGNILVNFTPSLGSDVIKMGFVISVAFSFPLVIFPCRASIYSLLYKRGNCDTTGYIPESRFKTITTLIVLGSLCIALLIPSIELVIGLVGSTIGVAICIIFPAACFRKISKKDSTEKTFGQVLIVGGCCLMILGTYANLSAIDDHHSGVVHFVEETATKVVTTTTIPKNKFENSLKVDVKTIPSVNISSKLIVSSVNFKLEEIEQDPNIPELKLNLTVPMEETKPIHVKQKETKLFNKSHTFLVQINSSKDERSFDLNGIANEAIKNEEQITAEEQKKKENKPELVKAQSELIKTKEFLERKVDELKEELAKQNKITQDLVVEKLGKVVEKVEEIERQVHEGSKNEKHQKTIENTQIIRSKASNYKILNEDNFYKSKSFAKKAIADKEISPDVTVKDVRVILPLPLLMNASKNKMNNTSNNKQLPQKIKIVDENATQREIQKEHSDGLTTSRIIRDKRSVSKNYFVGVEAKFQQKYILNKVKTETPVSEIGFNNIKVQGLGRDLKSTKEDNY